MNVVHTQILDPHDLNNEQIIPTVPDSLEFPQANVKIQGYDNYGFVTFQGDTKLNHLVPYPDNIDVLNMVILF